MVTELETFTSQLTTWLKWHPKPHTHRFWKMKRTINLSNKRWISLLQRIADKFKALDIAQLEKIEAFVKASWTPPAPIKILNKEKAIERAKNLDPWMLVFTDGRLEIMQLVLALNEQEA